MKKLLIFGAGETATIAAEFFTVDSPEILAGFVVDDDYHQKGQMYYGLPVHSLSEVIQSMPSDKYKIFVALSYGQLNRERLRVYEIFEKSGYEFATYISTKAMVWRTAKIGKNCMIFEGNNIQHNAVIEDNVILWSGNHIGHGSRVCHSAYVSSHVCIAGFATIGSRSFLGVNATVIDYVNVAEDCFVTAGAVINRETQSNGIYSGNPATVNQRVSALKYFKVKI
jgi:sugar O-acyltransferase (sialic acid O-acetyltransferase NeuD family)